MYRDYKEKDVNIFFVYKSLAHPQSSGFVRPANLEERLMHVEKAKESLGTTVPWLVDSMKNELKHAMGDRPNSEFIIDPDGKIIRMRDWSSPETLRADLTELVGKIDNPTDPRSLNMRTNFAPTDVARGVVERLNKEERTQAIKVETKPGKHPAYVKLRAEGTSDLIGGDPGKVYLGFFVDPIHRVHWNNQAGPVQVEVNGKTVTGPKVDEEADADPREFFVEVDKAGPINITLKYVACDDAEKWCRKLTQEFVVQPTVDRDAGRPGGGRGGRGGGRGAGGQRGQGGGGRGQRPGGGRPGGR